MKQNRGVVFVNRIQHFDMVFATTQAAINSELKAMWNRWIWRSSKESDVVNPSKLSIKLSSKFRLEGQLAAPTLDFNTGGNRAHEVTIFNFHIRNGRIGFRQFVEVEIDGEVFFKPEFVYLDIEDLTLSFEVQITKAHAARRDLDADIRRRIGGFPEDEFSVSRLLLDLTNADFSTFTANKNLVEFLDEDIIEEEGLEDVQLMLPAVLGQYFKDKGTAFPLGYVIQRKLASSAQKATFEPREYRLSIFEDERVPHLSSLNYLIMTGKNRMPGHGAGIFRENWVRQTNHEDNAAPNQGSFVIGKHLFLEKFLVPSIARQLNCKVSPDGSLKWSLTDSHSPAEKEVDNGIAGAIVPIDIYVRRRWHRDATLTVHANSNRISLSGTDTNFAGWRAVRHNLGFLGDRKQIGYKNITVTFTYTQDFTLHLDPDTGAISIKAGKMRIRRNEPTPVSDGFFKTDDWLRDATATVANAFKDDAMDTADEIEAKIGKGLSKGLGRALGRVRLNKLGLFVMPGTKVLKYREALFTPYGDLQMITSYQDATGGAVPVSDANIVAIGGSDKNYHAVYKRTRKQINRRPVWHAKTERHNIYLYCYRLEGSTPLWIIQFSEPQYKDTQDQWLGSNYARGETPWDAEWLKGLDIEIAGGDRV